MDDEAVVSKPKRATHRDVARRAGVSVATVSYVVNNGPRPVSDEARARVEAAIAELDYIPNQLARSLRAQQSSTIGLIIPSTANPFYAELARELERACLEEGFLLLLCNSNREPEREARLIQMLRAKQVDGVVITPHSDALTLIQPLQAAHIPVVVLEHDLPGIHCITMDELTGGRIATQHLIDQGHRRIGLLRRQATTALSTRRHDGYRAALEAAGIGYDPALVVTSGPGQANGYHAMQALLARGDPPTAVFAHNDVLAMGAMRAIHEAGLSIPGDISIVGYDDILEAAYLTPPLTTVRCPKAAMGALAGQTILALAQGGAPLPAQTVTLPVELVVRASTGSVTGDR